MIEQRYGHLSQRHKEATAVIFGGYMDRITGLGLVQGPATAVDTERPISAQVADLISGEAAQALAVARMLPLRLDHQPAATEAAAGLGQK